MRPQRPRNQKGSSRRARERRGQGPARGATAEGPHTSRKNGGEKSEQCNETGSRKIETHGGDDDQNRIKIFGESNMARH